MLHKSNDIGKCQDAPVAVNTVLASSSQADSCELQATMPPGSSDKPRCWLELRLKMVQAG